MTAKPLSAEEEAELRRQVTDPDGSLFFECADLDRVFRLLDASRAETAAVVRERDEARLGWREAFGIAVRHQERADKAEGEAARLRADVRAYERTMEAIEEAARDEAVERTKLRSLAADLVEGLAGLVARYGDFAPGKPFIFPPNHHIDLARALLTRAAALGVGKQNGKKEKE